MRLVADSEAVVSHTKGSERLSAPAREALNGAAVDGGIVGSVASLIDLRYVTLMTKERPRTISTVYVLACSPLNWLTCRLSEAPPTAGRGCSQLLGIPACSPLRCNFKPLTLRLEPSRTGLRGISTSGSGCGRVGQRHLASCGLGADPGGPAGRTVPDVPTRCAHGTPTDAGGGRLGVGLAGRGSRTATG